MFTVLRVCRVQGVIVSPFLSAFLAKLVPASVVGKIGAATVAVAVVAGGGTAALAATSPDTTTVSNDVEVTSPAPTESTDGDTPNPVETEVSTDPAETDATQTESDDAEPSPVVADPSAAEASESTHPDNHGRDVSEVAHGTFDSGREHGRAVSDAAHHHGDDSDAAEAEDESGTDDATVEQSTDVDSGGHGHH
jgi:hypothetical protein